MLIVTVFYLFGFIDKSRLATLLTLFIMMSLSGSIVALSMFVDLLETVIDGKICLNVNITTISLF